MRHAKAEQFAEDDYHRELTERGRRDAADAGAWLAAEGLFPTHAYVSSAVRAVATWDAVSSGAAGDAHVEVHIEDGLYPAGPDTVLDTLRTAPANASIVMYVGHNPTAASLAHLLDDGNPDPEAFRAMSEGVPTSAMAVLDVSVDWPDLGPASGRLMAFHAGRG